jgi:hypothetical protein
MISTKYTYPKRPSFINRVLCDEILQMGSVVERGGEWSGPGNICTRPFVEGYRGTLGVKIGLFL